MNTRNRQHKNLVCWGSRVKSFGWYTHADTMAAGEGSKKRDGVGVHEGWGGDGEGQRKGGEMTVWEQRGAVIEREKRKEDGNGEGGLLDGKWIKNVR